MINNFIKIRIFLTCIFLLSLFIGSCHTDNSENKTIINEQENRKAQAIQDETKRKNITGEPDKPLIIKENTILFFAISQAEYNLLKENLEYEVDEILYEFYRYAQKAIEILKKYGFDPSFSGSKNMIFKYSTGIEEKISINTKEHIVALILFGNNKKPKIFYGVIQDDEILKNISEYFKIDINIYYANSLPVNDFFRNQRSLEKIMQKARITNYKWYILILLGFLLIF